jgi:hypothetical protein
MAWSLFFADQKTFLKPLNCQSIAGRISILTVDVDVPSMFDFPCWLPQPPWSKSRKLRKACELIRADQIDILVELAGRDCWNVRSIGSCLKQPQQRYNYNRTRNDTSNNTTNLW